MEVKKQSLKDKLPPRQYAVYEAVISAGDAGIDSKELAEKYLAGRTAGTLRSCIYMINQKINPMKLAAKKGRYTLSRVNWSTEGLNETSETVTED